MHGAVEILPGVVIPMRAIRFQFTRSGGPGGQHVNKVATRVVLLFDVVRSEALSDEQKHILVRVLRRRIDRNGVLRIGVQKSRSQWVNREAAVERLAALISHALAPRKKRKPSKPTSVATARRLEQKRRRGGRKRSRSAVRDESDG